MGTKWPLWRILGYVRELYPVRTNSMGSCTDNQDWKQNPIPVPWQTLHYLANPSRLVRVTPAAARSQARTVRNIAWRVPGANSCLRIIPRLAAGQILATLGTPSKYRT